MLEVSQLVYVIPDTLPIEIKSIKSFLFTLKMAPISS